MYEIAVGVAVVVIMVKIAEAEGYSEILWGGVTILICLLCLGIPLLYLRFVIALVISYALMFGAKVITER